MAEIAFLLAQRKPSARFTYALGQAADVASVVLVRIILFSAFVAGYNHAVNDYRHEDLLNHAQG